jgi:hypothetical protein
MGKYGKKFMADVEWLFGKNPNLPNIMQAELPALEGTTCSEAFSKHLNALHETRKAYIQTEADERIRRALRSKVRAAEQVFENGDMVFYKREGKERWLEPGKVVFQDGKVVFVRHGGVFVRVLPNRLCKVNTYFTDNAIKDDKQESYDSNDTSEPKSDQTKSATVITETVNNFREDQSNESENQENVPKETTSSTLLQIKKNDIIQYKLPDSEERISATVPGKAGKMTGKNKTWYNVQDHLSNEQKSVDLGRLEWNAIENLHRDEEVHTTNDVDDTSCEIAKQLELQKLCHFDTYEEVEDCGQKTISTRWIITR